VLRGISCEEGFPCQLERDLACFDTFRGAVFKGHMSLHATAEPKNIFFFVWKRKFRVGLDLGTSQDQCL